MKKNYAKSTKNQTLSQKSLRGGIVTVGAQVINLIIQLSSTAILARLLEPKSFGIIALIGTATALANVFRDCGLSAATIQSKTLTHQQNSNIFWINIAIGLLLTTILAYASTGIAALYENPELKRVALATSLSFTISAIGTQHTAILNREMMFTHLSIIKISSSIGTVAITIILATQDYKHWSLVWGDLAGTAISTILPIFLIKFRPSPPKRDKSTKASLKFGANVTAFSVVNYFSRNLDNILIGKHLGAEALGIYSRAYRLLMFPIINLRTPIMAVAFPAMSKLDPLSSDFRNYYNNLIRVMAMVSIPAMMTLYSSAEEVVSIVLGEAWLTVVPVFKILAIVGLIQPIASTRGLILLSSNQPGRNLIAGLIGSSIVSAGFLFGIKWGYTGIAWAYVIAIYIPLLPMHIFCSKNTSICTFDLFNAIKIPLTYSLAAYGLIAIYPITTSNIILALIIKTSLVSTLCIIGYFTHKSTRNIVNSLKVRFLNR